MSASENLTDEASKDTNDRSHFTPKFKIRIRLPPRKRLSNDIQLMSTGVPEDLGNLPAKKSPEQTDNNILLSTTVMATKVKVDEIKSNPSGERLCTQENVNNLSNELPRDTVPEVANFMILVKGEFEKNDSQVRPCGDANNSMGDNKLLYETNSNTTSKVVLEEATMNNPSKDQTTFAVKCGEENDNLKGTSLLEEARSNVAPEKISAEPSNNGSSRKLAIPANDKTSSKKLRASPVHATEQNINDLCTSLSVDTVPELSNVMIRSKDKDMVIAGAKGELEKHNSQMRPCGDAGKNIWGNKLMYATNSNTTSKAVPEEATMNNQSKDQTTFALGEANDNFVGNSLFEEDRNNTATEKLSVEPSNNTSSRRPAIPANDKTSSKKRRASDMSQNTSKMKPANPDLQAVHQCTSAATLEGIKEYREFEEKVKRSIYLDHLSPLATEAVIKMALDQFGSVRQVNILVNYTVPHDIPRSALVEMENEKDAESVINMLHEFPFMMVGMPRPVRGKLATAEMFHDRPHRPGSKLEFSWVGPTNPDYENARKFKIMAKRHELENLALIKHELKEEELLAKQQQDTLNCSYKKLETLDSVTGWVNRLSRAYNISLAGVF